MDWLWLNKEWLFSGVGAMVVVAVGSFAYKRWWQKPTTTHGPLLSRSQPPQLQQQSNPPLDKLHPIEIAKAVAAAPFLLRDETAKGYYGIQIQCDGKVYGVVKQEGTLVVIMMGFGESLTSSVRFQMDVTEYPHLKLLRNGDPIGVIGIIAEIDHGAISLVKVRLLEQGQSLPKLPP